MSWAPRQLLTGWMARSQPAGLSETTFGRTHKKALKRNHLPSEFAVWSTLARECSGGCLPTLISRRVPPNVTPSFPAPSPPTPDKNPTNPNAPLPGDGNLAPAYVPPTWYVLLAHAQYTNIGPPITPPGALPTLTASTHQLSRKNLRRGSRATTEEEDSENLLGHL
jgi:hypothetical protein